MSKRSEHKIETIFQPTTIIVNRMPLEWYPGNHGFKAMGTDSVLFWVKPSLASILLPLVEEIGEDLYSSIIAYEASKGTYEDYYAMVNALGKTFEEGFLIWGEAVSASGWGTFEILSMDWEKKEAIIRIYNPWELKIFKFEKQQNFIPFLNGKISGIFSHAFGTNCRSEVIEVSKRDNVFVNLHVKASLKTLEQTLVEMHENKSKSDVVSLRATNIALRRDQQRLLDIIDTVGEVIWESDINLQITYATERAPKVFHIQDSVIGKKWDDFIGKTQSDQLKKKLQELNQNRTFLETEYELKVNNKNYWCSIRVKQLLDYNGNKMGYVGSARDITSQKEMELQILEQEKNVQYASKMATLGEMAGGIAHEINTPLAVISLNTEELQELFENETFNKESSLKAISVISQTIERIAKIVQGLRAFARDANQDSFQMSELKAIIDDTLTLCSNRFSSHGIKIIVEQKINPQIECRNTQINQVLLNLLNNSFDAINELKEKWIRISVHQKSHEIEIHITDSGHGIPEEIREKIMTPFFTSKPVGKGTGLGLSISKGIVEAHKGSLYYDKNQPHTTFVVKLPLKTSK